jgi:Fur family transcriptional regulator, ferric uptake regulator
MTDAPRVQPLAFSDLEEAVSALRARGLRLSTPRRLVLEALFAADGPVSAEWIADHTHVDITSVYRNLETLEAHGVVQHVHLGHGPGLHALVGPGEREYLYCEQCQAVVAVSPDELDSVRDEIRERFRFEARFDHFAIGGLCRRCASGSPAGPPMRLHSHGDYVHSHPPIGSQGTGRGGHSHDRAKR